MRGAGGTSGGTAAAGRGAGGIGGGMAAAGTGAAQADEGQRRVRGGKTAPMIRSDDDRTSSWLVWAMVIMCTVLAVCVIVAGATVFAVYLLYKPKMPYLVVADAALRGLHYGQDGTIHDMEVAITILAKNTNSRAYASFSRVSIAVGFHGADLAVLKANSFSVEQQSSRPLYYDVVTGGKRLDAAGMRSMDESLKAGVVPIDLFGKARTRWKMGIFVKLQFRTRISCRLQFFFPGNGTAMPIDQDKCRSKSP